MTAPVAAVFGWSYPPAPARSAGVGDGKPHSISHTPARSAFPRAALMASWSRSTPSTVMWGYAWAVAMLDQPVPHATSRTRAGGSVRSRRSTSTIAGSHSVPSKLISPAQLVQVSCAPGNR
jgi:hypothetical protein